MGPLSARRLKVFFVVSILTEKVPPLNGIDVALKELLVML